MSEMQENICVEERSIDAHSQAAVAEYLRVQPF